MVMWAEPGQLRVTIPAASHLLGSVRRQLQDWLTKHHVPPDLGHTVVLITDEALANAVEHGYRYDTESGEVDLTVRIDHDTIVVHVIDHGTWKPPVAEIGSTRGWGLKIIQSLADWFDLVHTGHGTTLTARLPRASSPDVAATLRPQPSSNLARHPRRG